MFLILVKLNWISLIISALESSDNDGLTLTRLVVVDDLIVGLANGPARIILLTEDFCKKVIVTRQTI